MLCVRAYTKISYTVFSKVLALAFHVLYAGAPSRFLNSTSTTTTMYYKRKDDSSYSKFSLGYETNLEQKGWPLSPPAASHPPKKSSGPIHVTNHWSGVVYKYCNAAKVPPPPPFDDTVPPFLIATYVIMCRHSTRTNIITYIVWITLCSMQVVWQKKRLFHSLFGFFQKAKQTYTQTSQL